MKKVWIINNQNMPPELGHFNRHYNFAKYLQRAGWAPTVFVSSYLHNTRRQMIAGKTLCQRYEPSPFPYYFIRTRSYGSSRIRRVLAMLDFDRHLRACTKSFDPPDVILGSSTDPVSIYTAIKLSKRYHCPCIGEVRDLWPESFPAVGIISAKNPIMPLLYWGEKWLYTKADRLIFTMKGGRDYIVDKGWDTAHGGPIDLNKVYHINNGVDLEAFDYNREHFTLEDPDLDDPGTFKFLYCGSIRYSYYFGPLMESAKRLRKEKDIEILLYGAGPDVDRLRAYCHENDLQNVKLKGPVEKKYIPYILSHADVNLFNRMPASIHRYGSSANKLFDYLASGRPILANLPLGNSLHDDAEIGLDEECCDPGKYASQIIAFRNMPKERYDAMCRNARKIVQQYDYEVLTNELIKIMEGCIEQGNF